MACQINIIAIMSYNCELTHFILWISMDFNYGKPTTVSFNQCKWFYFPLETGEIKSVKFSFCDREDAICL